MNRFNPLRPYTEFLIVPSVGGENLANRADEMAIRGELATGVGNLQFGDSPIDRCNRRGQLDDH
jgi:hypothetical protein